MHKQQFVSAKKTYSSLGMSLLRAVHAELRQGNKLNFAPRSTQQSGHTSIFRRWHSAPARLRASKLYAGLDLNPQALRLVILSPEKNRWRLVHRAVMPIESGLMHEGRILDPEHLIKLAHGLLPAPYAAASSPPRAHRNMAPMPVALALPASQLLTRRLILPAQADEQQRQVQVESEMAQYLAYPVAQAAIDFHVVRNSALAASSPHDQEIIATAAPLDLLQDRVELAEALNMKVMLVTADDQAADDAHPSAHLHIESKRERALLRLSTRRHPNGEITLEIGAKTAEQTIQGLLLQLAPYLAGGEIECILLSGIDPAEDSLAARLEKYSGIRCCIATAGELDPHNHQDTENNAEHPAAYRTAFELARHCAKIS
ncbi:pilus assembly protein PilM [Herbaspirillum lusitanum]|uniref:Pilus assembly protein PilM n=1 Tax=Herbaspirillum lusitanum TaxID=213312 RepID=A0ABW9AES5_9BURK